MIKKVDKHPLSIVNVAVSMNRSGVFDSIHWKSLAENIYTFLDENVNSSRILVYERSYSHSVSASMMLMVESRGEVELEVLFLIALLEDIWGSKIPECLVRFFMRRFCRNNPSQFTQKYSDALQSLVNNSLVQEQVERTQKVSSYVETIGTSRRFLAIHKLRREYIIQKRLSTLRVIASNLVAVSGGERIDKTLVNVRHSDDRLAVVLGALCFDSVLIEEVALPFQSLMRQINEDGEQCDQEQEVASRAVIGSVIPFCPQQLLEDVCESVKAQKRRFLDEKWEILMAIEFIMEVLNLEGEELWKQQVYSDASKVGIESNFFWSRDLSWELTQ